MTLVAEGLNARLLHRAVHRTRSVEQSCLGQGTMRFDITANRNFVNLN